jgi:plasmid stabilization system protein ParE
MIFMEVDWKQKAESDRDSIYDNLEAASKDAANGTDQKIAIGVADIASGLLSGHLVEGSTTVHRLVLSTGHYILYEKLESRITILRIRS